MLCAVPDICHTIVTKSPGIRLSSGSTSVKCYRPCLASGNVARLRSVSICGPRIPGARDGTGGTDADTLLCYSAGAAGCLLHLRVRTARRQCRRDRCDRRSGRTDSNMGCRHDLSRLLSEHRPSGLPPDAATCRQVVSFVSATCIPIGRNLASC